MADYPIFRLGDINLQSGVILPNAQLAYKTFGKLNRAKDNVIVMPTYYTGTHNDNARLVGPGRALDSERYFIIMPNMFCNSVSSSPSNTPAPCQGADFPTISLYDNVVAQRRLLTEQWGIDEIALVIGWSMGAQQTFQWAALYPQQVKRILPFCGSAKTSRHNKVFLAGVKAALTADPAWMEGRYDQPPQQGLKAFGRVYCGWAYSQAFFRDELYKELGFATIEELLIYWEKDHLAWDANDLLAMLETWYNGDISANEIYQGDIKQALSAISAHAIVMPCTTDLYFPPADSEFEAAHIPNAECRPIVSNWGHIAGNPNKVPADTKFLEAAIRELLATLAP